MRRQSSGRSSSASTSRRPGRARAPAASWPSAPASWRTPRSRSIVSCGPSPDTPGTRTRRGCTGSTASELERHGLAPVTAMTEFAAWVDAVRGDGQAVFVGFNAPFDWMFVADYCWRFLGRNPFGYAALDLKSLYMGRDGVTQLGGHRQGRGRRPVPGRRGAYPPGPRRRPDAGGTGPTAAARPALTGTGTPGSVVRRGHGRCVAAPLLFPVRSTQRAITGTSPRPPLDGRDLLTVHRRDAPRSSPVLSRRRPRSDPPPRPWPPVLSCVRRQASRLGTPMML